MARLMSVYHTQDAVRARIKTVTRRLGWWHAKEGDEVVLVEKGQGLGKGGKVVRIVRVRITSTRAEYIGKMATEREYGDKEATLEGFPEMSGVQFVTMFMKHMPKWKCKQTGRMKPTLPTTKVNRIEFEYMEAGPLT